MLFLFSRIHYDLAQRAGRSVVGAESQNITLDETIKSYPVFLDEGMGSCMIPESLIVKLRFPSNINQLETDLLEMLSKMGDASKKTSVFSVEIGLETEEIQWFEIKTCVGFLADSLKTEKFRILPALDLLSLCSLKYRNSASGFSGGSPLMSYVSAGEHLAIKLLYSVSKQSVTHLSEIGNQAFLALPEAI